MKIRTVKTVIFFILYLFFAGLLQTKCSEKYAIHLP